MTVCRTCLFHLINVRKYPIEQTLEASVCLTESNDRSSSLQLRKMIEKCIPEMVKLFGIYIFEYSFKLKFSGPGHL